MIDSRRITNPKAAAARNDPEDATDPEELKIYSKLDHSRESLWSDHERSEETAAIQVQSCLT